MTDNAVLHISYNNGRGHMTVNTLAFLSEQGIRNIRKLIKLIESSDTPDELEKLHSILREEISTFDLRLKELANRGANARTRYKELEPELERLVYQRERYKKSDQRYKDLMLRVLSLWNWSRYLLLFGSVLVERAILQKNLKKLVIRSMGQTS